jgi:PPK2 family polyphosphate:nucleotide phosphotransferase
MRNPDLSDLLRAGPGVDFDAIDPSGTPGVEGDRDAADKALVVGVEQLAGLQEQLFAASKGGSTRSVLLVLQAMDTAGKGGIVKHVVGTVDPQGVMLHAFKRPTPEEDKHDFLWRVRPHLPSPGMLGVFDRSHYEAVLIHKVRHLSTPEQIEERYGQITAFETEVAAAGTAIVKVMLHISRDQQRARLADRLAQPEKYWKYNPGDIDERELWPAYMDAYRIAIERTSTDVAPWYVVPADHKWYARLAVQHLLIDAMRGLHLEWPPAAFDVATEKARLAAS